jgi:aspartate aminotransferase
MPPTSSTTHAFTPSANVAAIRESATIAVSARARALRAAGRQVIDLGAGEPDFPTPDFIREAGKAAIDAGHTRYTPVEGIPPLRQAIADVSSAYGGQQVGAAEVMVTSGTKQALFNACFVLFGEGDDVLVPTPAWTSYFEIIRLARANPVMVFGDRDRELKVTAAQLADAATPETRAVVINSPCNPTGAVYDAEELGEILELAAERDWWVVSDEIYRRITYTGGPAPSALELARSPERLVVVDGVGKAFAMTGWRIGWTIAPTEVTRSMSALQSHSTSNASSIAQHAALAALSQPEAADRAVESMVAVFADRRGAGLEILRGAGADVIEPEGAFYFYVRAPGSGSDPGTEFAGRMLEEHDVAVVPGVAFGSPEWVRVSFAAATADVVEGASRVASALGKR